MSELKGEMRTLVDARFRADVAAEVKTQVDSAVREAMTKFGGLTVLDYNTLAGKTNQVNTRVSQLGATFKLNNQIVTERFETLELMSSQAGTSDHHIGGSNQAELDHLKNLLHDLRARLNDAPPPLPLDTLQRLVDLEDRFQSCSTPCVHHPDVLIFSCY